MCLDAAKELAGRTELAERVAEIASLTIPDISAGENVFPEPYFFENKQEFAARVGIAGADNIRNLEAKFCQISYLNFVDTKQGSHDCAVINVNYEVHLAWQFLEVRKDQTHTYNDFLGLMMEFIHQFTRNKRINNKIYLRDFVQRSSVVTNGFSKYLPDTPVSFVNFVATIEHR